MSNKIKNLLTYWLVNLCNDILALTQPDWPPHQLRRDVFCAFIANVKISAKQTHTSTLFDAVMLWQPAGFTRTLIIMIISLLGRNDILLSRWKTPASPAYFKPSVFTPFTHTHCIVRARSRQQRQHLKCIFSSTQRRKRRKRRLLIETYLACRISLLQPRKLRWMTGTPVGTPPPVGSRYCSL